MWADGEDLNENGEPVRLFQPILYSSARRAGETGMADPTVSHVGGTPSYFEDDTIVDTNTPVCSRCGQEMCLLLQLSISRVLGAPSGLDRTLFVFGCNKASCTMALFADSGSKFAVGGGGVFTCRRSQLCGGIEYSGTTRTVAAPAAASSTWGAATSDAVVEEENNWNVDGDEDSDTLDDMEAMVAAIEVGGPKGMGNRKKQRKNRASAKKDGSQPPKKFAFSQYEIHSIQEPLVKKGATMDEDDVGMGEGSDSKIQAMLARYMAEEDDEEILEALRGSNGSSSGAGASGGKGERDERLSAEDRALLAFTDRVKRVPRQILRYARGGVPLWSIPLPAEPKPDGGGRRSAMVRTPMSIPDCPCGVKRIFECQLLPSLLHVLDVDKQALAKVNLTGEDTKAANIDELMNRAFLEGGMNWGAIAIYSCSENCDQSREEFIIVQDSVDGRPEKRPGATEDAMVVDTGMDDEDEDISEGADENFDEEQ